MPVANEFLELRLRQGERVPAMYDLGYFSSMRGAHLSIRLNQAVLAELGELKKSGQLDILAERLRSEELQGFAVGNFGFSEKAIGFGDVFYRVNCKWPDFIEYNVALAGRSGEYPAIDFNHLFSISGTLKLICWHIQCMEISDTDCKLWQLMHFQLLTKPGLHGSEMSVFITRDARQWLQYNLEQHAEEIRRAMIRAADTMHPEYFAKDREFRESSFSVHNQGRDAFSLNVPGDAAGVYVPGYESFREDEGWELDSHNLDSPVQQLTLLAGLAATCGFMREDGL